MALVSLLVYHNSDFSENVGERKYKLGVRPFGAIAFSAQNLKRHNDITSRRKPMPKQNTSPDGLSPNARRKLTYAIKWLTIAAEEKEVYEKKRKSLVKWKINMITLTFQENMQDDKLARLLLSKWLEMAAHRFNVNSYVWKAEPQKRGSIHFHLITDVYIPHKELRYTWNRLLRKHGLGNVKNNSTDVHAIINVGNLVGYLVEYLCNKSKHDGRRKITGKLWGCSHALSSAGKSYALIDEIELQELQNGWAEYDLYNILRARGASPPDHLRFLNLWYLPEEFFAQLPPCDLKSQFMEELSLLRPNKKFSKELFPDCSSPSGGSVSAALPSRR